MSDRILRLKIDEIARMFGVDPQDIFRVLVSGDTKTLEIEYSVENG